MTITYVSATLPHAVDLVWSVLRDFHGIDRWVPRIRSSEPEDGDAAGVGPGAVGSTRRLTLDPDGRVVRERLVRYDAVERRYSYEFVGEQPFPVRSLVGSVHLLPVTVSGTTFIEWFCEFDADAADVERLTPAFRKIYAGFLDDLGTYLAELS